MTFTAWFLEAIGADLLRPLNEVQTGSKLYKEGGVGAFYRGVGWRTSRLICLVFIINAIKEPVAKVMYPHHFA